ncbi:hypothetical protein ASD15_10775 [Massilia sp. Root351]|jgi:uncharacterized SAM-binding protein YcdF (DUF218 family)|uniref:YdcF family protein n=1 Tax=Massilia sp. Root351 TaxID=1736522 RepID=UPI00070973AF|nr:YdcF family protein [Massilia sp. Root351]KQV82492.1 hypothetical protein ASD15_10775 [Massilia sp. Root351]
MFASALSQLAHVVLLPPMCLFLAMLAGWLLRRRWPRFGTALAGGGLAALVVLSTDAGARLLVRPLETMSAPLAPGQPLAQAIVVLAAGNMEHAPEYGGNSPDSIALARLRYGARLQHQTGLPLLVSGGNADPARGIPPKAESMARALREDFRTEVRWVEAASATTAENAAFSARLLKPAGVRTVLLVTDAMHMPRARRTFERAGLQVVAAPTMFRAWGPVSASSFLPRADALASSYYAAYEWIGLAWYRLME